MSFGWSAGDIAAAIKVVYNLYQALDSCHGAAAEYREAVSFLKDLNRVLESLKTLTALATYPTHANDIQHEVDFVKRHIEDFLQIIAKFDRGLGANAKVGHLQYIPQKARWHFSVSKKALLLRERIASRLHILETLMHKLTLDVVFTTQERLPTIFGSTLHTTISPELIDILRKELVRERDLILPARPSLELQEKVLAGIDQLKQSLEDSRDIQKRLESCLTTQAHSKLSSVPHDNTLVEPDQAGLIGSNQTFSENYRTGRTVLETKDSLKEAYYLVLVALGQLLRNFFLFLSSFMQPSKQMVPTLVAKYNITFFDAMGGAPRILPYEFFQNFKVLQVFINE
ncbi:hypothetical protein F5Y19DRAFT_419094 [Xylariaceae sp. FL1651]|nr:hypothetical protein F5Y19DRAFT_419094 [Xylariaceae sp. FL1651]